MLALLAQVDVPPLNSEGPDDLRRLLSVFFGLVGVGFVLGIIGHVVRSKILVGAAVVSIMLGAAVFLVAVATEG